MKKQSGFTLIELAIVVIFLFVVACICGLGYVAIHFIGKVW